MENSINFNLIQALQFLVVLLTGLLAGLFYGYDCSVVKGLGKLTDSAYLQSFQSINKAIQNPYFFISFMGCLLFLPLTTWMSLKNGSSLSFYLLLSATLVYFVGVFGITIFGNVPLNEQLDKFSIGTSTANELTEMRKIFEHSWNFYHRIRTLAAIMSFCMTILSIIRVKYN